MPILDGKWRTRGSSTCVHRAWHSTGERRGSHVCATSVQSMGTSLVAGCALSLAPESVFNSSTRVASSTFPLVGSRLMASSASCRCVALSCGSSVTRRSASWWRAMTVLTTAWRSRIRSVRGHLCGRNGKSAASGTARLNASAASASALGGGAISPTPKAGSPSRRQVAGSMAATCGGRSSRAVVGCSELAAELQKSASSMRSNCSRNRP
mmetsp:Transcript_25321/g.76813  ORF Transcript_25321/g.76813 Transcript_25321/m.76813 type:complete len:210 (+) Transcript_25321:1246-1875(+)